MSKCSICGQPIRVIPTGSKLKDMYNKVVLTIGRCCMRCAVAYKEKAKEADSMTYEERAAKTLERMKAQGMSQEQIDEAVKQADAKEAEINKLVEENKKVDDVVIKVPEVNPENLDTPKEAVSDEEINDLKKVLDTETKILNNNLDKIEKELKTNEGETMVEAYCMKCKTKRQMKNVKDVKMKNGNSAKKGECEKCGTSMYKIGGK